MSVFFLGKHWRSLRCSLETFNSLIHAKTHSHQQIRQTSYTQGQTYHQRHLLLEIWQHVRELHACIHMSIQQHYIISTIMLFRASSRKKTTKKIKRHPVFTWLMWNQGTRLLLRNHTECANKIHYIHCQRRATRVNGS